MPTRSIVVRCLFLAAMCAAAAAAAAAPQDPTPAQSSLGINLAGPADWSTEHPFVDVFKMSRKWISQRKGQPWGKGPELARDQHGWITRLEPDCFAETPLLTAGHAPSGEYICLFDGEGSIDIRGVRRIVSSAPGRIVVDVDGNKGGLFLQVRSTDPANYVRNIRLIMPGHEQTYRQQPFNPAFLARWRSFNTYRFMDWMETNGSKIGRWEQRPTPDDCNYTERGIPAEVMVELCNRQRANAWFCMPHLADDQYVQAFASYVRDHLDPSLKAHVEYSNEVWNSMFPQTRYAGDRGLELKLADKHWEAAWRYSARRSVEIFKIWDDVFANDARGRVVRVIASQMVPHVSVQKLSFEEAFRHCDALAIAPYIQMSTSPRPGKSDKTPGADEVASWTIDRLMDHVENVALPGALKAIQEQKTIADKYHVKLIAYEAGQHLVGVAGAENNDRLTKLFHVANRHPRMTDVYTKYLDGWKQAGGGLCCIFSSTGQYSKWGSWGLIESIDQTEADSPKLRAVTQWNRDNPN
jgi:hypothetical protein